MTVVVNPTNASQRRDWNSHHSRPDRSFLNLPVVYELHPSCEVSPKLIAAAVDALVTRHDALRTRFDDSGARLAQLTEAPAWDRAPRLRCADEDESLQAWIARETSSAFDLRTDAPAAFSMHTSGDGTLHLLVLLHHIIGDHISLDIATSELFELIGAAVERRSPDLKPITTSFPQRVRAWDDSWSRGQHQASLDYWAHQLLDAPEETPVPKVESSSTQASEFVLTLPGHLAADVRATAASMRTTTYVLALTAFAEALSSLTGATDQVFACGYANRTTPSDTRSIGRYVSGMALRVRSNERGGLLDLARGNHAMAMAAYSHARVSLDTVIESGAVGDTTSRTPFANVAFQLFPEATPLRASVIGTPRQLSTGALTSKRDLHTTVIQGRERLDLSIVHRPDQISTPDIERLADGFQAGIRDLVRQASVGN